MLDSRFILIFHIDMVDCNFIRSSNMNKLVLAFGQYKLVSDIFWGKLQFENTRFYVSFSNFQSLVIFVLRQMFYLTIFSVS